MEHPSLEPLKKNGISNIMNLKNWDTFIKDILFDYNQMEGIKNINDSDNNSTYTKQQKHIDSN